MELVYLWVEKYKNIEKQGFNFSPKFRCEYNENTNELKIEEKEYTSIFPENINITAIVGKNGSGKSSLLEVLKIIYNEKCILNYVLIYSINKSPIKIETTLNLSEIQIISDRDFYLENKQHVFYKICKFIYFHFGFLSFNYHHNDFLYDPLSTFKNAIFKNKELLYFDRFNILEEFISSSFYYENLDNFSNIFFRPDAIELKVFLYPLKKYLNEYKLNDKISSNFTLNEIIKFLFDLDEKINKKLNEAVPLLRNKNKLNEILNSISKLFEEKKILQEEISNDSLEIFVEQNKPQIIFLLRLKKRVAFLSKEEREIIKDFISVIKLFSMRKGNKFLELDIKGFHYGKKVKFSDLSNGEQILVMIYTLLKDLLENNTLIVFDEAFNDFHPYWQTKVIKFFVNELSKINNENSHIIFTTHSPFIISDLPKENIIFLDRDENGKCKVVDGLNEKKETFGANIHTLLSDSFFMEDGFIGKFAESKINDVINYLNGKESEIKTDKEAQKIINIIGEPIIKKELQIMLNSKRLRKVNEIDKVKREMRMLKNRLKELERLLDEKDNNK